MIMLFVLSFSSCQKGNSNLPAIDDEIGELLELNALKSSELNTDEYVTQDYSIIELSCSQSEDEISYTINYPQITGLVANDKQERINEIIEDEALKVLNYYENPFGSVEVTIDYNISLTTPDILSIQYTGIGTVSNAAHPNKLFYTTNIDIEKGTKIRLADVIKIDSDFNQKFINGEFIALWTEQSEQIDLSEFSIENLQEDFTEADSLDNIGTEKQSDVFSYFTEDSLGISIPVPYAIGGHAEYEIKYQDLKDNITENEIWEELIE